MHLFLLLLKINLVWSAEISNVESSGVLPQGPESSVTSCSEVLRESPIQLADVLWPSVYREAPPLILHETVISSMVKDGWVLKEQNLHKPTYGNMQPTSVVVPPIDSQFYRRRQIRRQMYAEAPDEVFITTSAPQLRQAGREILDLILQSYCRENGPYKSFLNEAGQISFVQDKATREIIQIEDSKLARHPLLLAGLLGTTDWIVMRKNKSSGQYVVAGGFVASPYLYNLRSQVSRSLEEIHEGMVYKATLPHAESQTKAPVKPMRIELSKMIPIMMNRLGLGGAAHGKALTRPAWFITDSPLLAQHTRDQVPILREFGGEYFQLNPRTIARNAFLRVEREVMFGLKTTTEDYLVFGLHPYVFTLEQLASDQEAAQKIIEGLTIDPNRAINKKAHKLAFRYLESRLREYTELAEQK